MSALRSFGIDAEVDLHHLSERGIDWTRFGPRAIVDRDWVIVVLSPAWRDRWEGTNAPSVGAGAVAEADALRSVFSEDHQAFRDKVVLVTLPSMAGEHRIVPTGLHGVQRRAIASFELEAMADLLRLLTGQGAYPAQPLGRIPALPPAVPGPVGVVTGVTAPPAAAGESPGDDGVAAPDPTRALRSAPAGRPAARALARAGRDAPAMLLYVAGTVLFALAGYVVAHAIA